MAVSFAHKFGQAIGDELEATLYRPLQDIADEFNLYLDYKHPRPSRNGQKTVSWKDSYGNKHDLDYVLEVGGCEDHQGHPRAFIETAWRRYTKHSRNKVQEIQGALIPLAMTYSDHHPFLGAILAGEFTKGALTQIQSHGFNLVYCPYETIIQAFKKVGLDISSDENTSEVDFEDKMRRLELLQQDDRLKLRDTIIKLNADQFKMFFSTLRACFNRRVKRIVVLTLSGTSRDFGCVADAVEFISGDHGMESQIFVRYELNVQYTNGDKMSAEFQNKNEAVAFLKSLPNT